MLPVLSPGVLGGRESAMKTVILLVLFAIAGSLPQATLMIRKQADPPPAGELINWPECGYLMQDLAWIFCDPLDPG